MDNLLKALKNSKIFQILLSCSQIKEIDRKNIAYSPTSFQSLESSGCSLQVLPCFPLVLTS